MREPLPDVPAQSWARLERYVTATLGLHFPGRRQDDLRRGFQRVAGELGFDSIEACIRRLLSEPPAETTVRALARHLTVSETYFFRDRPTFDALSSHVLPALIRARRGRDPQLRLWCAACCTGEEAYTLAILLHQLLPDLADWQITLKATDVNADALDKAADGCYSEWSFRAAPQWLRSRYFTPASRGRSRILPSIRRLVSFDTVNLIDVGAGGDGSALRGMDLILCRNVLMYFSPPQMSQVAASLRRCLAPEGWLVVGPGEVSATVLAGFAPIAFPGALLFRRDNAERQPGAPAVMPPQPTARMNTEAPVAQRNSFMPLTLAAQAAGRADASPAEPPRPEVGELARQARTNADAGRLAEALVWCDRWLQADKLDPAGHYVRAAVLLEQGHLDAAQSSLNHAVYLDDGFVLAHLALGHLARVRGQARRAEKHFGNVQRLLRRHSPGSLLPESAGLTVGQVAETIRVLTGQEQVR
jgi:chemotaxis protein methyltransferase CheR